MESSPRSGLAAALGLAALLTTAVPADAVLIASGDGTGNTSAPADDFGFAHVGVRGGLTGIYLGNGWVLTANHVNAGWIWLSGVSYEASAAPGVQLTDGQGTPADLLLYRLVADPGLPPLALASAAPSVGEDVVMIGSGRDRGASLNWRGRKGFAWAPGTAMRWGTNKIANVGVPVSIGLLDTYSFRTVFDSGLPTPHEATATSGDSGGGVFAKRGGSWELVGIQFIIELFGNQAAATTFYGNTTLSADLDFYGAAIQGVIAGRACSDGFDDDGDGLVDHPDDPGCSSPNDAFETQAGALCDDGFDDDGDGLTDSADPGCSGPLGFQEDPACDDGLDNDGDGGIDWDGGPGGAAADADCTTGYRGTEAAGGGGRRGCGLGFEAAPLLLGIAALRRRRGPR